MRTWAVLLLIAPTPVLALDPSKSLTQYTRTVWTQAQGLPQDTVRAIAQTPDGYLWLGASEGLARFDGYEFTTYTQDRVQLPSNAISVLWVDRNGNLWIGTSSGLTLYSNGQFRRFTEQDGLPPGGVSSVNEDSAGVIWLAVGGRLTRFEGGRFVSYQRTELAPVQSVRVVYSDRQGQLWIGGIGGVAKRTGDRFVPVLGPRDLSGNMITSILQDARGTWIAGINGILLLRSDGSLR